MTALTSLVAAAPEKAEVVRSVDLREGAKMVALTFDDGPGDNCNELMDLFRKENVKVTFFVNGKRFKGNEAILKRMVADGHEIGNHGYSHAHMKTLTLAEVEKEIDSVNEGLKEITGKIPAFFRAPYGEFDDVILSVLGKRNMKVGGTRLSTRDWDYKNVTSQMVLDKASAAKEGSIIVFHSWSKVSFAVMPQIIANLKERGIQMVTVSELYANSKQK